MMLLGVPRPVYLLLFIAAVLVLRATLQSIFRGNLQFSPDPLFAFALFTIIIAAIIAGDHRPSSREVDDIIPGLYHAYEPDAADDGGDTKSDKYLNLDGYDIDSDRVEDNDDESEDYGFDSDGYDEDDDDNGSNDEIGWGDMDEYDSNLEKRCEDFIDKVKKGWREERSRDSLSNALQLSYM